jgi:hypothetical protein
MSLMPEHLHADTVAAFAARALNAAERSQVFEHLADCDRCREWIAVNSEVTRPSFTVPTWAMTAAAGIACSLFAGWLMSARPAGETLRKGQLPITMGLMEPHYNVLPPAWQQVRLVPDLSPGGLKPTPRQVALKNIVGEKWITVDGLFESIVP